MNDSVPTPLKFDEVHRWSEVKLEIIKSYAHAYTTILSKKHLLSAYIDAFAGSGIHLSKTSGDFIPGSPLNAFLVTPPFNHFYFIDIDKQKFDQLNGALGHKANVELFNDDANKVMLQILPEIDYHRRRRALCLLDPYGLHLDWSVIELSARLKTCEIFLNFPVADMNRNVLWGKTEGVAEADIERMNRFWGDESWRKVAYKDSPQLVLWGESTKEKTDNETVAEAFRKRLKDVAGFSYVPKPLPMKNDKNSTVYYLFFAAHQPVADKIVNDIFNKFRK